MTTLRRYSYGCAGSASQPTWTAKGIYLGRFSVFATPITALFVALTILLESIDEVVNHFTTDERCVPRGIHAIIQHPTTNCIRGTDLVARYGGE